MKCRNLLYVLALKKPDRRQACIIRFISSTSIAGAALSVAEAALAQDESITGC